VSADWGDCCVALASCCADADFTVVTFSYVYETLGTFTVDVMTSNLISSIAVLNQTISVYQRIHDLVIYGNSSVLAPPGTGVWVIAAGPSQLPLENIVCVWSMGSHYADVTSHAAVLNSSVSHEISFGFAQQADVGTQAIHVNCSNPVSSQNMTTDVSVIWDNVTLGELTCNSSTLWNHSISCQLTIVRFGTGACFEWDMGDGEPVFYYQDAYCAVYVPAAASANYVQVFFGEWLSLQQNLRLFSCQYTIDTIHCIQIRIAHFVFVYNRPNITLTCNMQHTF